MQSLEVFEPELEAYVQTSMKKDIPVQLESIRVRLTPGIIAADARLTIPPVVSAIFWPMRLSMEPTTS
jgi:hypothetical protein